MTKQEAIQLKIETCQRLCKSALSKGKKGDYIVWVNRLKYWQEKLGELENGNL